MADSFAEDVLELRRILACTEGKTGWQRVEGEDDLPIVLGKSTTTGRWRFSYLAYNKRTRSDWTLTIPIPPTLILALCFWSALS